MVYVRKIKTKDGTKYAEVEGVRIGNKFVQKHIRYIGKMSKQLFLMKGKKEYKFMRQLEIIKNLDAGKNKFDIATIYEVSVKTVENIEKRFEKDGVKGLIHTRSSNVETVKVSTPEQAAIITDAVLHPTKTPREIKEDNSVKITINEIKKLISPLAESIKLKKKLLLEIE